MDSYIVAFWAAIFSGLSWVSLFSLVRRIAPGPTRTYAFVDSWALAHLFLASFSLAAACAGSVTRFECVLLGYAGLRIFELTVYQVNVLLFDEYRARRAGQDYAVRGYRRLVVLSVQNYIEVLLWFAFVYRNTTPWFESNHIPMDTIYGSLYFAVVTVATLGYGDITPVTREGTTVVVLQSAVGFFMTLMILARFIAILRTPATLDPFEACVSAAPPNTPLQPPSGGQGRVV
jgi:hypothetical protein